MPSPFAVTVALFGLAAGVSLLKGARPERLGGGVLLLWLGLGQAYHLTGATDVFIRVHLALASLDTLVFLFFAALALFANRLWPIFAAAFQSIVVLGHASMLVAPGMQRAYWAMTQVPPLFVALAVLLGTIAHVVRLRRLGPYRDWRRRVS